MIITVGSVMMALVGLILGLWAKDVTTLYTAVKAGGNPHLPPCHLLPVSRPAAVDPEALPDVLLPRTRLRHRRRWGLARSDVVGELAIAVVICIALVPVVAWVARRTEHELAILV